MSKTNPTTDSGSPEKQAGMTRNDMDVYSIKLAVLYKATGYINALEGIQKLLKIQEAALKQTVVMVENAPDGIFAGGFYYFCCRRNTYPLKFNSL